MLLNNLAAFKRDHFVLKTPALWYKNFDKKTKLERKLFSIASVTLRRDTYLFVLSLLHVLNLCFEYTSSVLLLNLNLLLLLFLDNSTAFACNQPFN